MSGRARLIFWGSLALNVFLAGLIAGSLVIGARAKAERERDRGQAARSLWTVSEQFEPGRRDEFRAVLEREAEEAKPRVQALRASRREAAEIMAREPFDPTAAAAGFENARMQELALRRDLDQAILAFAVQLTPEERGLLGEAMRRRGGARIRDRGPDGRPLPQRPSASAAGPTTGGPR